MSPETSVISLCEHRRLDNGVHEFVFHDASRAAFDEFLNLLEVQLEPLQAGEYLLVLMDWRKGGMPPLRYAFQRTREQLRKYPNFDRGRSAILYKENTLISMAQTFIDVLRRSSRVRFFASDQREAALTWLMERKSRNE